MHSNVSITQKKTALCWIFDQLTLEGTNISHPKKRKVIFESTWVVDMLLSWRVLYIINPFILSKTEPIYNNSFLLIGSCNPPPLWWVSLSTKISWDSLRPSHPDPVLGRDRARRGSIACEGCHTESPRNHCWVSPGECNNEKTSPQKNAMRQLFEVSIYRAKVRLIKLLLERFTFLQWEIFPKCLGYWGPFTFNCRFIDCDQSGSESLEGGVALGNIGQMPLHSRNKMALCGLKPSVEVRWVDFVFSMPKKLSSQTNTLLIDVNYLKCSMKSLKFVSHLHT